jgi:hypothetical protein
MHDIFNLGLGALLIVVDAAKFVTGREGTLPLGTGFTIGALLVAFWVWEQTNAD